MTIKSEKYLLKLYKMDTQYQKKVVYLTSMFPHLDMEIIESVLESCEGSVNIATDYLLKLDENPQAQSSPAKVSTPPIINPPNLPPPMQSVPAKKAVKVPPKAAQEPRVILNDDFLEISDEDSASESHHNGQNQYIDPFEQEKQLQKIIEQSILEANQGQKKPKKAPLGQRFKAKMKRIFGNNSKKTEVSEKQSNNNVLEQDVTQEPVIESLDADEDVIKFYVPNDANYIRGESLSQQPR